jgi:hypothetical protein
VSRTSQHRAPARACPPSRAHILTTRSPPATQPGRDPRAADQGATRARCGRQLGAGGRVVHRGRAAVPCGAGGVGIAGGASSSSRRSGGGRRRGCCGPVRA